MKQLVAKAVKRIPAVRRLILERDRLKAELERQGSWVPPGHFYSPLPDLAQVRKNEARLFERVPRQLPGLDMNEAGQLRLLEELKAFYPELPFPETKQPGCRYYYENANYSYSDAIFLYGMIRRLRPRRVIEVGSGFSSCVTLDTNERFFGNAITCTFIEPYPELLLHLLGADEAARVDLIRSNLQDVPLATFDGLEAGDILFIDSTHVSKIDSDVNYLLFEILPALRRGVFVHIHDIAYPFEYPREWVYEGRAWNEMYILRAFLQYNQAFRIAVFNSYLHRFHSDWFTQHMPLCQRCPGGSIWLEKVS